jgi:4-aminobutyrate aminotransferase-like enzyme
VQEVIARDRLLDDIKAMDAHLARRLGGRFGSHSHVGAVRGRGLFMGGEPVEGRGTKAACDPSPKLGARIKRQAMNRGLEVAPSGGTVDERARRPHPAGPALHHRRRDRRRRGGALRQFK